MTSTSINSAHVDQMLAALAEANAFAPGANKMLLDPDVDAGDPYTRECALMASNGYEVLTDSFAAAEVSGLDVQVFVRPGEGAVLVRGDFAETYRDGYSGPEEPDWPTALSAVGLATFVGEQECRRCWMPGAVSAVVQHVLRVACGRTVVEMAYCDACMHTLDAKYGGLVWEYGGPDAAL